MAAIRSFIKREPVLLISLLAALISCFFVAPDAEYLDYIDLRTLALLYALMTVVAGMRKVGVFTAMASALCKRAKNVRTIGILLVCLCFFCSMLITNDVALLTFVPFTIIVLGMANRRQDMLRIILLQTVAANLGSMLTPVGNPQNLHIYSFYEIPFAEFLASTFPVWMASLLLMLGCCFVLPNAPIGAFSDEHKEAVQYKPLWIYLALFAVCLLTVLRILYWPIMLLAIVAVLLFTDRRILLQADFMLLLTFVAFFVFAGNLARIQAVNDLLQTLLEGKTYWTSLLASQVISNVPAALLLSKFTSNAKELLLGVNIGGLGTPIASLASLIGLKLYARTENARMGRFLLEFTIVNLLLLALLSAFFILIK